MNCIQKLIVPVALVLVSISFAPQGMAQGKIYHTYPMPPPVKPTDPLSVNPGAHVPERQESYQFVTTPSRYTGTDEIVVYQIDSSRRRSKLGTLPAGTEVKMTSVTSIGKTIYYAIPWQNAGGPGGSKVAWINGYNIKASSYNPSVK